MSPPNALFSAAAFIGFILVLSALPWHLQAWNVGTCCYMIWVGLACLNQFVNSVIWNGNALNIAPIWCDISSRLIVGVAVAVPASSLCISRRLYKISSLQAVSSTKAERRRDMIVDLFIAVGLPVLQMILQIIVEGHRFDIWQDIGCMPLTYNVTLAYPIVFLWPLVIGLISMCYSIPSIIAFRKQHSNFVQYLASSSSSSITANRYLRLMILSSTESLLTVPLAIYVIVVNATLQPIQPWISWEETHFNYARVGQFPRVLWTGTSVEASLESGRWMVVVCALVSWAFFGTGEEAKKWYGNAGSRVLNVLRRKGYVVRASMPSGGTLPVYIRQEVVEKRSSLDTFASVISEDLPSFKASDLIVPGRDSTFGSTTTLGNDTTDTTMTNSAANADASTGQGLKDMILDISSNSRLRSDSLPRTGTPLLPDFAVPDEYSTSPSSHFALPLSPPAPAHPPPPPLHIQSNGATSIKRSTTVTSSASGLKSGVPSTTTTNWSRSSAAISASEMFAIQRYHREEDALGDDERARRGDGDDVHVCGLEAEGTNGAVYVDGKFPRSPTLGDRLSFLSRKTTLRRPSCKASDMPSTNTKNKPLPEIKPSPSTYESFPLPLVGEPITQLFPERYPAPSPPFPPPSSNSPTPPSRNNARRSPFVRPPPLLLSASKMRRSAHSSFLDLTLSPASVNRFSIRR